MAQQTRAGGTLLKPVKVKAKRRQVDYFFHGTDFECPLLAAIGLTTEAIAAKTGLTPSQVMYRVSKYEHAIRQEDGEPTSRRLYRSGQSDIAKAIIDGVSGHKSNVTRIIKQRMEAKGLMQRTKR